MASGIDVYNKYQNVTDWAAVHGAGYSFCYVKVSDGSTARSTSGYGPGGRAAGLAMGAYHYAQPGDPVAQADLLISQATASGCTDLGPALDLEAPFVPGATAANFAIAFLRRIRDRGFLPVLYGSDSMLSYVAPQVKAAVPQTWIWVARYGANPKTPYGTWQYSSAGSVPGVSASGVDLNTGSVPLDGTVPVPTPKPFSEPTGAELMERITVTPPNANSNPVRVKLSGSPGAAIVIRPRLGGDGFAVKPLWVGDIFAWGNDHSGVGHNPTQVQGYNSKLTSHRRYELPGALWADINYSAAEPFEIDCF